MEPQDLERLCDLLSDVTEAVKEVSEELRELRKEQTAQVRALAEIANALVYYTGYKL